MDLTAQQVSFVTNEGVVHTASAELRTSTKSLSRITFYPSESRIEFSTSCGTIGLDIGSRHSQPRQPVIYLDQNHWIDLARWEVEPSRYCGKQAEFYSTLSDAATKNRVLMPLSSAHLVETTRRGGKSRLQVAATMLRHSRGWQVRTVLELRRAELRALFGATPLARGDVITLDPQAIFASKPKQLNFQHLGPELAALIRRLDWSMALSQLLLDDEPYPREDDSDRWASSFKGLATAMKGNPKARPRARALTRTRFFSDLGTELPAAASESGMTPERFGEWLANEAENDISLVPGLARLREVMHLRLVNSQEKWEGNDLNDWFYLSYAGAYCDLVLGEKRTINHLKRIEGRVPQGAHLHYQADEALAALNSLRPMPRPASVNPTSDTGVAGLADHVDAVL